MRCSWCEPLLDAYVEGTLDAAQTGAMAAHLRTCTACDAAHRRLRVVDALLMTARAPELARGLHRTRDDGGALAARSRTAA